jgi:hypothetical protein
MSAFARASNTLAGASAARPRRVRAWRAKLGVASKGRKLTAAECHAVEDRLRREGKLTCGASHDR